MRYVYRIQGTRETVELEMTVAELVRRQRPDGTINLGGGRIGERDWSAENAPQTAKASCWPMESDALGVHPGQIPEASRRFREMGVPTRFAPNGAAILENRRHRAQLIRARGFHDRDGGYSD